MRKNNLIHTGILLGMLFVVSGMVQATQKDSISTKEVTIKTYPLILEYSLFDLPFNNYGAKTVEGGISTQNQNGQGSFARAVSIQSPAQATQLTNSLISAGHWGISKIPVFPNNERLNFLSRFVLTTAFDVLMTMAPYGSGWLHEEGHRAIMANSYTYSYNPFIFNKRKSDVSGDGLSSVSHVLDTNLVMMKAKNNANFVRMSTMGGEMNIYSVLKMQQTNFFHNPASTYAQRMEVKPLNSLYYLLNLLNVSMYIAACSQKDELTDKTTKQIDKEGSHQELRDFTGMDFAAWAYDLSRPDEPYSKRGQNRYGNGYDRYIYGDKLTGEEYRWLKKQSILSFFNLLSPMNILIDKIQIGENRGFNFSGRYYPTSFGNQIGIELYYQTPQYNIFLAPHLNQNKSHSFPGIEAMLYELPISFVNQRFLGTFRVVSDMQPKNQEFQTGKIAFTGLAGVDLIWKAGKVLYPFISMDAKTRGWIAGNPFLNSIFSIRMGISARFAYKGI